MTDKDLGNHRNDRRDLILDFELIPDACWGSNLRTLLTKAQWDVVRREAYGRADGRCMICGAKTARLEAHERWSYDEENMVQKLVDVVAVCKACHEVIHIGRTQLVGREEYAIRHFCKVNGCAYPEYRRALGQANESNKRRNGLMGEWKLDLHYLEKFARSDLGTT